MSNVRLQCIDVLKGIGIILMVIGHMHYSCIPEKFIFGFHMPLFFIISGYLYSPPNNNTLLSFIKRKAASLLKPYLIIGILYFCIYALFKLVTVKSITPALVKLEGVFFSTTENMPIESALWFLPALFWVNLMYVIIDININYKNLKYLILTLITVIGCVWTKFIHYLPWGINSAMSVLGFFAIGYWYRISGEELFSKYENRIESSLIKWFICIILMMIFGKLIMLNDFLNTRTGEFGIFPLSYLNACIYCYLLYFLSKDIRCVKINEILSIIGINSIIFLCTNHPALKISSYMLKAIGFTIGSLSEILLEFFVAMTLMLIMSSIVKRTKLKAIFNF